MLSKDLQQPSSPFSLEGLEQRSSQQMQASESRPLPPKERNRGRGFRRAGNACEITAGAALNSAIVFSFHLLQVHPVGFVLALGVSHFYFTATAAGEGRDRLIGNVMTGASSGLAALCSLSEPIGEWMEAGKSKATATQEIQQLYAPPSSGLPISGWVLPGAIAALILLLLIGGKKK